MCITNFKKKIFQKLQNHKVIEHHLITQWAGHFSDLSPVGGIPSIYPRVLRMETRVSGTQNVSPTKSKIADLCETFYKLSVCTYLMVTSPPQCLSQPPITPISVINALPKQTSLSGSAGKNGNIFTLVLFYWVLWTLVL